MANGGLGVWMATKMLQ